MNPETAVEQPRREDTKLRNKEWCVRSPVRQLHPRGEPDFLLQPVRLRAFAVFVVRPNWGI